MEEEYYVRFNEETNLVDVFRKEDSSLIESVEVINGIANTLDVEIIAHELGFDGDEKMMSKLDYDLSYAEDQMEMAIDLAKNACCCFLIFLQFFM